MSTGINAQQCSKMTKVTSLTRKAFNQRSSRLPEKKATRNLCSYKGLDWSLNQLEELELTAGSLGITTVKVARTLMEKYMRS